MISPSLYFSEELFFALLCFALIILLYIFGGQLIKDYKKNKVKDEGLITTTEVSRYFIAQGYIVCKITPVKNSNRWLAFLIRNGEYVIATAFTKGNSIEGHRTA